MRRFGGHRVKSEEVTLLLEHWADGEDQALALAVSQVYLDLRRSSRAATKGQPTDHTLSPTALLNEVYVQLAQLDASKRRKFPSRGAFFAYAARAMRHTQISYGRRKRRPIHGGDLRRKSLDEVPDITLPGAIDPATLISIHELLEDLYRIDAKRAQLIDMRFTLGKTAKEIARDLGGSVSNINRDLRIGLKFLGRELDKSKVAENSQ